MLQTSFPDVKPQHTTEDILEDVHHESENYGTHLDKITPLFGMLFHICVCGEALQQIGILLRRIGNVSLVKQMAISKVAEGLKCIQVLFQE